MAVLPAFLISVLAIGSISVIGILIAGKTTGEKFGFQKVQVAVVIPDHSQTTEMLMNLIAGMDSTAAICDFNYLSEQEAYKQLEAEMVDAVIKVSPDFYNDVNDGKNSPVVVSMKENGTFEDTVFAELLVDGVRLVQVTEAAIYGTTYAMNRHEMETSIDEMQTRMTNAYVGSVLLRAGTFDQSVLSAIGKESLPEYYTTAGIVILLIMLGICYEFLYQKEEIQIIHLLQNRGLHVWKVTFAKTMAMAIPLWFFMMIAYSGMLIISSWRGDHFLYGDIIIPFRLFLDAYCISSYFHMIYSCFGRNGKGGLVIFAGNILMCILSGILIPGFGNMNLVAHMQKYIPITIWRQYLQSALFADGSAMNLVGIVVLIIVFEGMGAACLCKRI